MEENKTDAEDILHHIRDYFKTLYRLTTLSLTEKASITIGEITFVIVLTIFFCFFLLFGSIALAFVLASYLGSKWAGFLVVSGLYLVLILILWFTRKVFIEKYLINFYIQLFLKDDEESEKS